MEWTNEDLKLIRQIAAKDATETEFNHFLYIANKYNLDPLIKQIWCVKFGSSAAAIYAARDGFLTIAHKSNQFNGMETVSVREATKLIGAKCTVHRKDMTHPFIVEVALSEYNTGKSQWLKMPETMIKKVAESQCLRKAFDVSGLYSPEEYDPASNETTARPPVKTDPDDENTIAWKQIISLLTANKITQTSKFLNENLITKDNAALFIQTEQIPEMIKNFKLKSIIDAIKEKLKDEALAKEYSHNWENTDKTSLAELTTLYQMLRF
jgi:phage recombination protein Bet